MNLISTVDEVKEFIKELRQILCSDSFDMYRDFDVLMKKKTDKDRPGYTTRETMVILEYDKEDIYNELLALTESDYINTVIDDKDTTSPPFYAFVKPIQSRDIYIKVKIRKRYNIDVFCVSFHFAEYDDFKHPFAGK